MIKVLVILDNDLDKDGRVMKELAQFRKHNINYHVLCFDFGKDYKEDLRVTRIPNGSFIKRKLYPLNNTTRIYSKIWTKNIKIAIEKHQPEFLHVHDLNMMEPTLNAIKKMYIKPKVALDLHENYPYAISTYPWANGKLTRFLVRPKQWKKKEKKLLIGADTIIILHNNFRDQLVKEYPELETKLFVEYPNYPDFKVLDNDKHQSIKLDLPRPILFYFGVIGKRRGIRELLNAFIELRKQEIQLSLLLIGPVDKDFKDTFEELIYKDIVQPFIKYLPWVDVKELPSYMKSVDIAIAPFEVSPQTESGVANKVYQYMYGGLPQIVSNCKPQVELIEKHQCGLVYKNQQELFDQIKRLVENAKERKQMGQNAKTAIDSKIDFTEYELGLINLYTEDKFININT